jgi:hypothetical protein
LLALGPRPGLAAAGRFSGRTAQHNRIHLARDELPIIQVRQQLALL